MNSMNYLPHKYILAVLTLVSATALNVLETKVNQ